MVWQRCLLVLILAILAVPALAASPMVKGSCAPKPDQPVAAMPAKANALLLLQSLTQLRSKLGQPVLDSNFATTVAINNTAPAAVRAQAIRDAQVTAANANTLADGLGARMGAAYREKASFTSDTDGREIDAQQIGPAVGALIKAAIKASGSDSGEAKCAFANGVQPYQGGTFELPESGAFDVLGKAYHLPAGAPGADQYGNSRPFQTASIDATSGPRIATYDGTDFFGVAMNSRVLLQGSTEADLEAGRYAESLVDSPSYPSGHTTFGYGESLLLAMLVPERYRALAYRASEYGNSRIVLGAHYAIDVIGGRTLATHDLAQNLAGTAGYGDIEGKPFRTVLAEAASELRGYLAAHGCPRFADCAASDPIVRAEHAGVLRDGKFAAAQPGDAYAFRLTYGLAAMAPTDAAPEPVPPEAGLLLSTRFPYLTQDQRREILRTTEGPSGHFLDVDPRDGAPLAAGTTGAAGQAGVYSRLDLFAAAGGPVRIDDDLVVNQDPASVTDPDLRPFVDLARDDTWSNDIAGRGGLIKRGGGTLRLAGASTFAGAIRIEGGVLNVAGSVRAPIKVGTGARLEGPGKTGDVSVEPSGVVAPRAMRTQGSLTLSKSAVFAAALADSRGPLVEATGAADIEGSTLRIDASGLGQPGRLLLLKAEGGIHGAFAKVAVAPSDLVAKLTYGPKTISISLEPRQATSAAQ